MEKHRLHDFPIFDRLVAAGNHLWVLFSFRKSRPVDGALYRWNTFVPDKRKTTT